MHQALKAFVIILLLCATIFTGCASEEEKKLSHFKKGQAYFEKGEYKAALLEYKNAVKIDPRFIAANLEMAKTQVSLGDAGGAYKSYRRVSELAPDNLEARIALVTFYLLERKLDESANDIELHIAKGTPEPRGTHVACRAARARRKTAGSGSGLSEKSSCWTVRINRLTTAWRGC